MSKLSTKRKQAESSTKGRAFIGTSGYTYPEWRKGVFYPVSLPHKEEFSYYSSKLPSLGTHSIDMFTHPMKK
jgi:hypothetical protein